MAPLLLLSLASPHALANGQTTHVWISRHALEHLPEGELRDLLTRPELLPMLLNGTMFPDGGYPQTAPYAREYAETAHWEPFQGAYLDWIVEAYPEPYSEEAAQHIAFLMGLASHGMADQSFDAFYFNWSSVYDADYGWSEGKSFDEASDVIWASLRGPQEVPEKWVPYDTLLDLYHDVFGIPVDRQTVEDGQDLLQLAISFVGLLSENPDVVDDYKAQFPWGGAHLEDTDIPGNPACEGQIVALYWQDLWERLHHDTSEAPEDLVLTTWPHAEDIWRTQTDRTLVTSRISVVFARGLDRDELTSHWFTVVDDSGAEHAVDPWLFYGTNSHIVHLTPVEDWPDDMGFTVTVEAGLPFTDGRALAAPFTFRFSTADPPPLDLPELVDPPEGGCSALPSGASGLGLLLGGLGLWRRRQPRG